MIYTNLFKTTYTFSFTIQKKTIKCAFIFIVSKPLLTLMFTKNSNCRNFAHLQAVATRGFLLGVRKTHEYFETT